MLPRFYRALRVATLPLEKVGVGTFRRNVRGTRTPRRGVPTRSGVQGVDQLIQFVRDGLHLGLSGRVGDGPDQVFSQPSTNLVNWPRISPEDSGELSAGKLGSRIGVDISNLWFVFRRPCSTPARPPAQAAKRPAPTLRQKRQRGSVRAAIKELSERCWRAGLSVNCAVESLPRTERKNVAAARWSALL